MSSNITALDRKVTLLLDQADSRRRPKTLVFVLEQGDALTRAQRASIGPYDRVVIREYPRGLLRNV